METTTNPMIKLLYINQHWNVYMYSGNGKSWRDWIDKYELKTVQYEDQGEFRLRKYQHPDGIPIYSFGFMYNDANAKKRPGHGGEWSSNPQAINRVFGTELMSVALDNMAGAVPRSWMKEQLGNRVMWGPDETYDEFITFVKGEKNEWDKWVVFGDIKKKPEVVEPMMAGEELKQIVDTSDGPDDGCPHCGSYEGDATECPECGHGQ